MLHWLTHFAESKELPSGYTYLMCNDPLMNPWNPDMDIYTVWPMRGPRVNEPIFIEKMEQFRNTKQEYASVRATRVRSKYGPDPCIKIEFTFFDSTRRPCETSDIVHSKKSFWQTICTRKPFTLRHKIGRVQTKLLDTTSHHTAGLIKDIVLWIENEIYKKCVANDLWVKCHEDL